MHACRCIHLNIHSKWFAAAAAVCRYGDLLPYTPNSPEAVPDPAAPVLPLHAAPCVVMLRSLSLRLLQRAPPPTPAATTAAAGEWKETVQQLEQLEMSDAAICCLTAAEREAIWPWASEEAAAHRYMLLLQSLPLPMLPQKQQQQQQAVPSSRLIGYLAYKQHNENSSIKITRLFVDPKERRKGVAEAFFSACMLTMHNQQKQQQQQQVTCVVPLLACKFLESLGFKQIQTERGPHLSNGSHATPYKGSLGVPTVALSLDLAAFAQRLLRP